jgi:ubiquinone/menaquinone biosynthesis C-methylase UbiE
MKLERNNNSSHWSNYWKGGNLTSLPQDFQENYDGEIALFWKNAFNELEPQSEVLDLCTGNGAIALLAASFSEENHRNLKITAIDAAKVEIKNLSSKYTHLEDLLMSINFISECRVEDISLSSDSFDLITSQYGIEYCDWVSTANQISRLLKPGGKLVFISHANSTDILSYMKHEQTEYNEIQKMGFFRCLESYFKNKASFKETIRSLKKINKSLVKFNRKINSSLYAGILNFLNHLINIDKKRFIELQDEIRLFYHQHIYAYARLEDVLAVSKKINDNPDWYLTFEEHGLKLEDSGEILQSGVHNAGKYYKFSKPDML